MSSENFLLSVQFLEVGDDHQFLPIRTHKIITALYRLKILRDSTLTQSLFQVTFIIRWIYKHTEGNLVNTEKLKESKNTNKTTLQK